jgi:hypothetical protein
VHEFSYLLAEAVDAAIRVSGTNGAAPVVIDDASPSQTAAQKQADNQAAASAAVAAAAAVPVRTPLGPVLTELLSFIADRDVFVSCHHERLAKRLLAASGIRNEDVELAQIAAIRTQCGVADAAHCEAMINDARQWPVIHSAFAAAGVPSELGEFTPLVISRAHWPADEQQSGNATAPEGESLVPLPKFVCPHALHVWQERFVRHYTAAARLRRLTWLYDKGTAALDIRFPSGSKEVTCTIFQAAMLLFIDDPAGYEGAVGGPLTRDRVTIASIASALNLPLAEVRKGLHPAIMSRATAVLRRVKAAGARVNDEETLELNPDFTFKMRKLRLPVAVAVAPSSGGGAGGDGGGAAGAGAPLERQLQMKRRMVTESAIMRVMKARQELTHAQLRDLVQTQTSRTFLLEPRDFKLALESLIEREFVKRQDDGNLQFLA